MEGSIGGREGRTEAFRAASAETDDRGSRNRNRSRRMDEDEDKDAGRIVGVPVTGARRVELCAYLYHAIRPVSLRFRGDAVAILSSKKANLLLCREMDGSSFLPSVMNIAAGSLD